jgi:hypothetical protein
MDESGTVATICVSDQLTMEDATLAIVLNQLVLPPCVAPKPVPLIWTCVPAGALAGDSPVTIGFGMVKTKFWLLESPLSSDQFLS